MSELLEIADRVIAQAAPGEQVEAYVSRGDETEIRVYGGDVEHFVAARSEGIGIRVIRDGRTGFAYAGTLDGAAIAEVLAEARDNVEFGTVDEWAGLAEPDGVPMTEQTLWNEALAEFETESKIDLAKELEKLTTGVDPRVRVDEANYADGSGEAAVATTTGIRQYGRENGCYVSVSTLADDGDETQTGFGFSVGREPAKLDVERAAREASDRATRLLGATKPPSRRLTVVLDPFVTAQFLGIISSTLSGEAVVKGRSIFRDRLGEAIAPAARHARRRSDRSACVHRDRHRRRGSRGAAQHAHRQRRAAPVRALVVLGAAGGHDVDRQCRARRVQGLARRRVPRAAARPGRA